MPSLMTPPDLRAEQVAVVDERYVELDDILANQGALIDEMARLAATDTAELRQNGIVLRVVVAGSELNP